jgi:lysozyme
MKRILIITVLLVSMSSIFFIFGNLAFKSDSTHQIRGVDISNQYSGELNWTALDNDNDFVILRAIRAVDTCKVEGLRKFTPIVDRNFSKNWNSLKKRGIVRGAYHFFAPDVPAEIQFNVFKQTVQLEKGDLPPILDVENGNCNMDEAFEWLSLAKQHYGVDPILYSEYFFYKLFLKQRNQHYPTWLYINGNFMFMPDFKEPACLFWQYRQDEELSGFQESVDFNMFLGDSSDFSRLLIR